MAFRLIRLLNLYQRQEENCLLAYQEAKLRQEQAEQRVKELEQELAIAGHQPGVVDGERLRKFWAFRKYLGEQLIQARVDLETAQTATEQAQVELLAARQRRKTLEVLKEKHDAQERQERARKEQVMLDEAGLRTHRADIEG
jgi:flagellar export protein FliJ